MGEVVKPKNTGLEISRTFHSDDGSIKYVLGTQDGRSVEAIYFPFEGNFDGQTISANVVCLSSQVGCPVECTFCETGRMPSPRNLTKDELVSQMELIDRNIALNGRSPVDSIAMMGMGEPLLNLRNILDFHDMASKDQRIERFSISTVGVVTGIRNLKEANRDIKLYVSVHTPFNNERSKIIPISSQHPIEKVIAEARAYASVRNQKVVANYILISGVNDSERHMEALSDLLDPDHFDVTLNILNPISRSGLSPSPMGNLFRFKQHLGSKGFIADIQLSKGTDIAGGCGQLVEKSDTK